MVSPVKNYHFSVIDGGLVVHLQANYFFCRKTMESHLFYFSWYNDYTNDFADCSIWQRKVQFMEESWRALEINFAYIWLYLVTELPSHSVISLMPNAAYAKLQLLPKFKKVNLTFPIHVDIRENICQILMLLNYTKNIRQTFLIPRMQGRGLPV